MTRRRWVTPALFLATMAALPTFVSPADAAVITWDNGATTFVWSTGTNWSGSPDNTEPTIADDVVFTSTGVGTITLSASPVETANSLTFTSGTTYTLSGGYLTLGNVGQANAGRITVHTGLNSTINSTIGGTVGLTKAGTGTLSLGGTNYITGGITVIAGTLATGGTHATGGGVRLGNNAINLGSGTTLNLLGTTQYNTTASVTYLREFSGTGTFGTGDSMDGRSLVINALNDAAFSGAFSNSSGQGMSIAKTGPGTQTISAGTISLRGVSVGTHDIWRGTLAIGGSAVVLKGFSVPSLNIYGGTLTIDESTSDLADRLGNDFAVSANSSGTFRYLGANSATSNETAGALSYANNAFAAARGTTLDVIVTPGTGGAANLTFASFLQPNINDWHVQRAVNFVAGSGTLGGTAKVLFTTAPTRIQNGLLNSAYANGTDFAAYDATNGVIPFASYTNPTNVNTPVATDTVLLNGTTSTLTLTNNRQYNALKIDGALTVNLSTFNLTLGTTGANALAATILKTGAGQAEITGTGEIVAANDVANFSTNYNIRVHEGALKITAPLDANSNGRLQLLKSGTGVLWLAPNGTWQVTDGAGAAGGGISVAEGTIRLNPADTDFGQSSFILAGGVFELSDGTNWNPGIGTANTNVRWQSSGGFAAYGANAAFSPNITWNAANHIPDGAALLLNSATADSKITLSGIVNLGTDATKMYLREINVVSGASANAVAEISGQIISDNAGTPTDTYHLLKTGTGTLIISHSNNTYSGATYVHGGKLLVNGTLAAPASANAQINPDYAAVTVMNGGTLGGSGTINRKVIVQSGGRLAPGNSPGTQNYGAGLTFNSGSNYDWEHNAGNALGTAGTDFDVANITGGSLTVTSGANLNLLFASGTDFSNSFWDSNQTWNIVTGGTSGSNFFGTSNIFVFINGGQQGTSNAISGQGSFSTAVSGSNLALNWTASGGTPNPTIAITTAAGKRALVNTNAAISGTYGNTGSAALNGATVGNLSGQDLAATITSPSGTVNVLAGSTGNAWSGTVAAGNVTGSKTYGVEIASGTINATAGSTLSVVTDRSANMTTSVSLGRQISGYTGNITGQTLNFSSTGSDATFTRITINGVTYNGTTTAGSFSGQTVGVTSLGATGTGTIAVSPTNAETDFTYTPGTLTSANYSATPVADRVVTTSAVDLGYVLRGGTRTLTGTTNLSSGSGDDASFTRVFATNTTNGSGIGASGGTLTNSSNRFDGTNTADSRTISGAAYSTGSYGTVNGAVTLGRGQEGLAGESTTGFNVNYSFIVGNAVADKSNSTTSFGAALTASVAASGSYANLASQVTATTGGSGAASLGTEAIVVAGYNNGGSADTVSMAWRTRTVGESDISLPTQKLYSDVVRLTGMTTGSDIFALQMNYAYSGANESDLKLGWLNGGTWVNAILGNTATGGSTTNATQGYLGSWSAFETVYAPGGTFDSAVELQSFLGSYGVDTSGNTVWAILNHNSDFAVIPEPTSLALLGLGAVGLLARRRRN